MRETVNIDNDAATVTVVLSPFNDVEDEKWLQMKDAIKNASIPFIISITGKNTPKEREKNDVVKYGDKITFDMIPSDDMEGVISWKRFSVVTTASSFRSFAFDRDGIQYSVELALKPGYYDVDSWPRMNAITFDEIGKGLLKKTMVSFHFNKVDFRDGTTNAPSIIIESKSGNFVFADGTRSIKIPYTHGFVDACKNVECKYEYDSNPFTFTYRDESMMGEWGTIMAIYPKNKFMERIKYAWNRSNILFKFSREIGLVWLVSQYIASILLELGVDVGFNSIISGLFIAFGVANLPYVAYQMWRNEKKAIKPNETRIDQN